METSRSVFAFDLCEPPASLSYGAGTGMLGTLGVPPSIKARDHEGSIADHWQLLIGAAEDGDETARAFLEICGPWGVPNWQRDRVFIGARSRGVYRPYALRPNSGSLMGVRGIWSATYVIVDPVLTYRLTCAP